MKRQSNKATETLRIVLFMVFSWVNLSAANDLAGDFNPILGAGQSHVRALTHLKIIDLVCVTVLIISVACLMLWLTKSVKALRRSTMLHYAVVFLVIALIAGVLGFGGIAGSAIGIAKILFFIFLVLFVVSLLMGRRGR